MDGIAASLAEFRRSLDAFRAAEEANARAIAYRARSVMDTYRRANKRRQQRMVEFGKEMNERLDQI